MKRGHLVAVIVLLLGAFLAQAVAFAAANGQTYDEAITLAAGYRILHDGRDDLNLEHPPLAKVIAALPVVLGSSPRLDLAAWRAGGESPFGLGRAFLYDGGAPHARVLALGRSAMIGLALLHVALVGLFAGRLWGVRAGLLALVLVAFDPNLIAHGALVGHDAPLALFATCTFFAIFEYTRTGRGQWLGLAGVAAGLALLTKYSGVAIAAAAAAALLARAIVDGRATTWWGSSADTRSRAVACALVDAFCLVGVALLLVRVSRGGFHSMILGVRAQLAHQGDGHPGYLLGAIRRTGWPEYVPIAIALKVPPLTLALAAVSIVLPRGVAPRARALASVVVPIVVLGLALASVRVAIGVRYALPIVPLLAVLGARVATFSPGPSLRVALVAGMVHHAVAALRVAPYDLAFFSDLCGGPARGARYLSDSNLDWGQDIAPLGRWLAARPTPRRTYLAYFGTAPPAAYGVAYRPAPNACPHAAPWAPAIEGVRPAEGEELLAVSVMNLQGVFFDDPDAYRWLAGRRPLAVLGHAISVFDVTGDAEAHRALARMYERYGPAELARDERARVAELTAPSN